MTGRDLNSFGMVIFIGGLLVALLGPFLSSGDRNSPRPTSFNWYILGGLAMVAGACIMYG